MYQNSEFNFEADTTIEESEKVIVLGNCYKFEIVLDIIKINSDVNIGNEILKQ